MGVNLSCQAVAQGTTLSHPPPHQPPSNNRPQALDKARKDLDKARRAREPLTKRLAEDPAVLASLAAEIQELTQQLGALGQY
jgi:cysteinyl-tRNA synthetase